MESLKQFIVENWQFISTVIIALLTIIFGFLRRKPVVENSFIDEVYARTIYLINEAEKIFASGQGARKKEFVIGCLKEQYPHLSELLDSYKKDVWTSGTNADDVYSYIVEKILSTPQKKQGKEN